MILPKITYPDALEIFGEPTTQKDLRITKDHPFVDFFRRARAQARGAIGESIERWNDVGVPEFVRSISNPSLRMHAERSTRQYPWGGAFTEAVINAVEHGSDYGERGDVEIDLRANDRALFFSVSDPGPGITTARIQEAKLSEGGRGNGLVALHRVPAIVTCDTLEGKFRLSLLYSLPF